MSLMAVLIWHGCNSELDGSILKNTKERREKTRCGAPHPHAVGTDVPRPDSILEALTTHCGEKLPADKPVVLGGGLRFWFFLCDGKARLQYHIIIGFQPRVEAHG